jgi:hypothetical protein
MNHTINHIRDLAATDAQKAAEHGVDLNPFSTVGMRGLWQQGWDGQRPELMQFGSANWRAWQRGSEARMLAEAQPQ